MILLASRLHGLRPVPRRYAEQLMEVDTHCGFSRYLTPPMADLSNGDGDAGVILTPERHYSALMAALVAHGTNLGISAMADSTENLTVRMLQHVSRTCLREETIRWANAEIVNYHRSLDVSQFWGEGQVASSDGQRFGVRASSLLAAFYPRYFGYYDRAVSVYPVMRTLTRQRTSIRPSGHVAVKRLTPVTQALGVVS
jgi:hypothetical protein